MSPINFGVLMIEYQMIDAALPLDILSSCSKKLVSSCEAFNLPQYTGLTDKAIDINFHHIGVTLDPVELTAGYKVVPTTTCDTCPPLDYLLVGGPDPMAFKLSDRFADFIRAHAAANKVIFTTCTGAVVIAAAGILDGKNATVNHEAIPFIKNTFPNVKWDEKKQWVVDGNIWTASGAFAGADMIAHWVMENYAKEVYTLGFLALDFQPRDVNRQQLVL